MTIVRSAKVERVTRETQISLELTLPGDAPGHHKIDTPIPLLSHMLETLARHGAMQLDVHARGDTHIDDHHTVEDTGLVLGSAIDRALGPRLGISRCGHFSLCIDEVLVDVAVDLSGRPFLVYDMPDLRGRRIGAFDCDLLREFFQALAVQARMNLHIHQRAGGNVHHLVEAAFKALARALRQACAPDLLVTTPSPKGTILP